MWFSLSQEGIFDNLILDEELHPTISSKDISSRVINHTPLFPVILDGSSWMVAKDEIHRFQYFQ